MNNEHDVTFIFFLSTATSAIDTEGTINNIYPSEMITLDQAQNISTETQFNALEVVNKLEVHGTIDGQKLNEFLPNPTLEETNEILASCVFKELIIEGTVKIENSLNDVNIEKLLSDVVYDNLNDDELDAVAINSQKTFINLQVDEDIGISSNFINDMNIDNIMTTNEDQVVSFGEISGNVIITDLKLNGLFDGINATELEMNSVRTFGDQYIQTSILISSPLYIDAKSIEIKNFLNKIPVDEYFFITEKIQFPRNMQINFNEVNVKNFKANGEILGNGILSNLNSNELQQYHLSKSTPQNIQVPVEVKKLVTNDVFGGKTINGMDFAVFQNHLKGLKNFKNLLLHGNHRLDNLIIDGDVNINTINGKDFNYIIDNVIWLNRPNLVQHTSIKFLDDIEIDGKLLLNGRLNKKKYDYFIANWISSKENPVKINADKIFNKDIMVEENLELESINGIKYEDILKQHDILELQELNIIGTVNAKNLIVKNAFNHEQLSELQNLYSFEKDSNTHVINADVKFNQNVTMNHFECHHINEINVSHWMSDLIGINDHEVYIKSNKKFKGAIMAEQGVYIDDFNEINTKELMRNIVLLKNNEFVYINSNIVFENEVFTHLLGLRGNLTTDSISGCDLGELILQAIPTNRDYVYQGIKEYF